MGFPTAVTRSPAVKVFVCNLMTESNESLGLSAADHIRAIYKHTDGHRIFDYALVNRTPVSEPLKEKYALEDAAQIVNDLDEVERTRGSAGQGRLSRRNRGRGAPCHRPQSRAICWRWLRAAMPLTRHAALTLLNFAASTLR